MSYTTNSAPPPSYGYATGASEPGKQQQYGQPTYYQQSGSGAAAPNPYSSYDTTNNDTSAYYTYDSATAPLTGGDSGENGGLGAFVGATVAESDKSVRLAFLRRVYLILLLQIGVTMAIGALFMYVGDVKTWVQTNYWIVWVNFIPTIIVLIALSILRRRYPVNFILLMAFTLLEGYTLGVLVTFFDVDTVLQAVIITFGVFLGLTVFTFQTKWDFSGLAPILFAALFGLIMMGFTLIFFYSPVVYMIYCILGVVIFTGLILVDTHQIIHRCSPEDYIIASVELYLDVINLFLFILRLLQICKN